VTAPQRRSDDGSPGIAEVVRILEELRGDFRAMRTTMEATYQRQDVYKANREADRQVVTELRGDLNVIAEQQQWNRRIAVSGLLLPVMVIVIGAVILAAVGLQ
jgi:hypothetical protein